MDDSFNKYMNYYVNQQVAMIKPTTKRNRSLIYQQINDLGAGEGSGKLIKKIRMNIKLKNWVL